MSPLPNHSSPSATNTSSSKKDEPVPSKERSLSDQELLTRGQKMLTDNFSLPTVTMEPQRLSSSASLQLKYADLQQRINQTSDILIRADQFLKQQRAILSHNLGSIQETARAAVHQLETERTSHPFVLPIDDSKLKDVPDAVARALRVREEVREAREGLRIGVPAVLRNENMYLGLKPGEALVLMRTEAALQKLGLPTEWSGRQADSYDDLAELQQAGEVSFGEEHYTDVVQVVRQWKAELNSLNEQAREQGLPEFYLSELQSLTDQFQAVDRAFAETGQALCQKFEADPSPLEGRPKRAAFEESDVFATQDAPLTYLYGGEFQHSASTQNLPLCAPTIPQTQATLDELIHFQNRCQLGVLPRSLYVSSELQVALCIPGEFNDLQKSFVSNWSAPPTFCFIEQADPFYRIDERLAAALLLPKEERQEALHKISNDIRQTVVDHCVQISVSEQLENTTFHRTAEAIDLFTNPFTMLSHAGASSGTMGIHQRAEKWIDFAEFNEKKVLTLLSEATDHISEGSHSDGIDKLLSAAQRTVAVREIAERYEQARSQTEMRSAHTALNLMMLGMAGGQGALAARSRSLNLAATQAGRRALSASSRQARLVTEPAAAINPGIGTTRAQFAQQFPGLRSRLVAEMPLSGTATRLTTPARPQLPGSRPGLGTERVATRISPSGGNGGGLESPGQRIIAPVGGNTGLQTATPAKAVYSIPSSPVRGSSGLQNSLRSTQPKGGVANNSFESTTVSVMEPHVAPGTETVTIPGRPDSGFSSRPRFEFSTGKTAPELPMRNNGFRIATERSGRVDLVPEGKGGATIKQRLNGASDPALPGNPGARELVATPGPDASPVPIRQLLTTPTRIDHFPQDLVLPKLTPALTAALSRDPQRSYQRDESIAGNKQALDKILDRELAGDFELTESDRSQLIDDVTELFGRKVSIQELEQELRQMGFRKEIIEELLASQIEAPVTEESQFQGLNIAANAESEKARNLTNEAPSENSRTPDELLQNLQTDFANDVRQELEEFSRTHRIPSLSDRVRRGLNPVGMLAHATTDEQVRKLCTTLGASYEEVRRLCLELQLSGPWKQVDLLSRAETEPAAQAFVIIYAAESMGGRREMILSPAEFIADTNRLHGLLKEANQNPEAFLARAHGQIVRNAQQNFRLNNSGVPVTERDDGFLAMALLGYRAGIAQDADGNMFVGAEIIGEEVFLRNGLTPQPVVQTLAGGATRNVVNYLNSDGDVIATRLYPGFIVVHSGQMQLASAIARAAEGNQIEALTEEATSHKHYRPTSAGEAKTTIDPAAAREPIPDHPLIVRRQTEIPADASPAERTRIEFYDALHYAKARQIFADAYQKLLQEKGGKVSEEQSRRLAERIMEKQKQKMEEIKSIVEVIDRAVLPESPIRIMDMAGGSGELGLGVTMAMRLRGVQIVATEIIDPEPDLPVFTRRILNEIPHGDDYRQIVLSRASSLQGVVIPDDALVVAKHPCGDLADYIVKKFATESNAHVLCLMSCCQEKAADRPASYNFSQQEWSELCRRSKDTAIDIASAEARVVEARTAVEEAASPKARKAAETRLEKAEQVFDELGLRLAGGIDAMDQLDQARIDYLRRHGFDATLIKNPQFAKGNIILAVRRSENQGTAEHLLKRAAEVAQSLGATTEPTSLTGTWKRLQTTKISPQ